MSRERNGKTRRGRSGRVLRRGHGALPDGRVGLVAPHCREASLCGVCGDLSAEQGQMLAVGYVFPGVVAPCTSGGTILSTVKGQNVDTSVVALQEQCRETSVQDTEAQACFHLRLNPFWIGPGTRPHLPGTDRGFAVRRGGRVAQEFPDPRRGRLGSKEGY